MLILELQVESVTWRLLTRTEYFPTRAQALMHGKTHNLNALLKQIFLSAVNAKL